MEPGARLCVCLPLRLTVQLRPNRRAERLLLHRPPSFLLLREARLPLLVIVVIAWIQWLMIFGPRLRLLVLVLVRMLVLVLVLVWMLVLVLKLALIWMGLRDSELV